jgi:hypothetical protein
MIPIIAVGGSTATHVVTVECCAWNVHKGSQRSAHRLLTAGIARQKRKGTAGTWD